MNTLENAFLDALAADLRVEPIQTAQASQEPMNPRTGKPYQEGISLEPAIGAITEGVGAAAKGAAQGFAGLPGDVISLVRGLYELGRSGGDIDAFLGGLESKTALPTTEDIKEFLDEIGLKAGTGESPMETVGEFAAPGGYVKGAKAVGKAAKKVLSTPPRGSIKLAPNLEVEIAPAERSKNFKNWFGSSKIVDEKGKPLVMYHGTPGSFDEFGAGPRQAIFFSFDPKFASGYAGDQKTRGGMARPNVMPVYIKASNPFDYSNPDHVKKVQDLIKPTGDEYFDGPVKDIATGDWAIIELKRVQEAIKRAGFDAFYVMEDGVKNIGVFDPKQIKSAIGNKGTFDPNDPNIVRGAVAAPVGAAAMQDEEQK